jgi:hypothetical protein
MMELPQMLVHVIFPRKAEPAFTSAFKHGAIHVTGCVYRHMVPLQVGWASETALAYFTYGSLWPVVTVY